MAPLFLRTILWLRRRSRAGRPHLLVLRIVQSRLQAHVHKCRLSTIPGDAVCESLGLGIWTWSCYSTCASGRVRQI